MLLALTSVPKIHVPVIQFFGEKLSNLLQHWFSLCECYCSDLSVGHCVCHVNSFIVCSMVKTTATG